MVRVVEHDAAWGAAFAAEAARVASALGDIVVAVHHVGSTSIAGIYAKPVIDMLVEVGDIGEVDGRSAAMESLGYEAKGEFGIAGRRYFRRDNAEGVRTHQVHVFAAGAAEAVRHLAFRDYLIAHPAEARAYSDLKQKLTAEDPSPDSYMDGKDGFIKEIDRRAARWRFGEVISDE